jgi:hypothetical protein
MKLLDGLFIYWLDNISKNLHLILAGSILKKIRIPIIHSAAIFSSKKIKLFLRENNCSDFRLSPGVQITCLFREIKPACKFIIYPEFHIFFCLRFYWNMDLNHYLKVYPFISILIKAYRKQLLNVWEVYCANSIKGGKKEDTWLQL